MAEYPFNRVIDFQEGPGIMARDFREEGVRSFVLPDCRGEGRFLKAATSSTPRPSPSAGRTLS